MIAFDYDFSGLKKVLVMLAALVFVIWMRELSGVLLWLLAAWYCSESHEHYKKAKAYKRLGGHMGRAINQ